MAVLANVLAVPGVLDAYVISNDTAAPATIGGVSIGANALYVAAVGGDPQAIALAIWTKKMPGGPYYAGNTTRTVVDSNPLYALPKPSYSVTYQIPAALPIVFTVRIANSVAVPSDAKAQIQAAILAAFSGADGGSRARIGATVYASRFYAGIAALGAWAEIVSILIGSTNAAGAVVTASIAATVLTVTVIGSGVLAVGQVLFGANVIDGTTILAQLTGSAGSTGTYTVSHTQTAASASVTAVAASLNSVGVNINQVPVTDAPDIAMVLV